MNHDRKQPGYARNLRRLLCLGGLLLGPALAGPASAVDGVVEINQARVAAGGITTGDFGGFPASITERGSYRLTSDLMVPSGSDGIVIGSDDVTLDLNGFNVLSAGGGNADGISIASQKNVEVRNGTVRGFSRSGIFTNNTTLYIRVLNVRAIGNAIFGIDLQGQANTVDGCTALNNNTGIRAFEGSLIVNSVARGNTSYGLYPVGNSGYRSNVLTGNNGGDANPQVGGGGLQLGSNVCGTDLVCP
jgi:parallel beta helix pectate lyase-like protein